MRSLLLYILFLSFCFGYAQTDIDKKISINFKNAKKIDVIKQIEGLTDYHFYFVEDWLDNTLISGQYDEVNIKVLLDSIFDNTVINYYITKDDKIILTQSVLIHDTLPDNFIKTEKEVSITKIDRPTVFMNKTSSKFSYQTVRIGKENSDSGKKTYTLSGYVKNISSNKPIPNLALLVKNKTMNTVTDDTGFYTLKLPAGVNFIETKSIGLQVSKKKVIIYEDGKLDFYLIESVELLDEVIVEATKDQNVKEAITGITHIKVEAIKNIPLVLGERDILKVAMSLPGITTAGEGSSGYNVRGGKTDQNLILLDNGVLYNPSHFFGIFSALNPFTTGDVNIYKGSIPAEYGGRLSSVFEINTKNDIKDKLAGEFSVGPVTSNITLEIPIIIETSSLLIGGRGTYSGWILKLLDDKALNKSKASFYDVIAKYNHKINDNNKLEATGYFSKDNFSITSDSLYGYSNRILSLKWNHKFNDKNLGSLILANSEYQFDIEFDGDSDKNFNLGYKINETQLKLRMKYMPNEKHKFDYGISSKLYTVNPGSREPKGTVSIIESIIIPEERALESAIFISDNFDVTEKLLLNLGIRYSLYASLGASSQRIYDDELPRNDETVIDTRNFAENEVIKTYGGPEIRASVRYSLSPDFSVKASFNSTNQFIHTLSNNTTVSPTDTWKLSDLNIKPQESNQYSFGFYKNFDGNTYELSLESYYKESKNIIDYKIGADLLLTQNIETQVFQGIGKAYGVEFLIKKTKGRLNGWLGYSYSRSLFRLDSKFSEERVNNGEFFPSNFDKPHDVSLVANYKLTKRFSLSANFAYQTGRPVTYPVGNYNFNGNQYVLYSNRNEFRIPDYYRLDLGFNVEGNHKIKKLAHSFWNISIYNILGRNNPYSVFFVTENGEIKAYKSSIFAVPIPTITYNIKF